MTTSRTIISGLYISVLLISTCTVQSKPHHRNLPNPFIKKFGNKQHISSVSSNNPNSTDWTSILSPFSHEADKSSPPSRDDSGIKERNDSSRPKPQPQQQPPYTVITLDVLGILTKIATLSFISSLAGGDFQDGGNWLTGVLFGGSRRNSHMVRPRQHFKLELVNDRYKKDQTVLQTGLSVPISQRSAFQNKLLRRREKREKRKNPPAPAPRTKPRTVIVMKLNDGGSGTNNDDDMDISTLSDSVSFLLDQYRDPRISRKIGELEVILLVESPGGAVHEYGLIASQLSRLRNYNADRHENGSGDPPTAGDGNGIVLTVCVDRVAASGGYMIACQASEGRLFAAPFATLGSIGVRSESLNFQKLAERWGVRPLLFRSGKYKASVGMFGDATKEQLNHEQEKMDEVHRAFKRLVMECRPGLVKGGVDSVATGEVWLGMDALRKGLVDRVLTSDEYIEERVREGDCVLRMVKYTRPSFFLSPMDFLPFLFEKTGVRKHVQKIRQVGTVMAEYFCKE